MLKQYLDSSNFNSSSAGRRLDTTFSLKRKKSKTLSALNSSFESSVRSPTNVIFFLERFKFQMEEINYGRMEMIQLHSRESLE